jgi:hypothetical protein
MARPAIHPGEILADGLNEQTSAQFWLNLQSAYDLRVANDEIGGEVAALPTKLSKRRGGGSAKNKTARLLSQTGGGVAVRWVGALRLRL